MEIMRLVMPKTIVRAAVCALFVGISCTSLAQKPRVVVLTDISYDEPDDAESLVRFLLYANEFDVEGLIATTSIWRWKANDPIRAGIISDAIRAYGEVHQNLIKHADGYPSAEHLMSMIKEGRFGEGMDVVGSGQSTEASRHIISVVDRPDDRPVWLLLWGGAIDLAQALYDVQQERSPEEVQHFVAKLRVYEIAGQDNTGAWIAHHFPDIFWMRSVVQFQGMSRRVDDENKWKQARGGDESVFEASWIAEHIQSHGPLGKMYLSPHYKHEGDTPAFLHLLSTGLAEPEQISYGNWGGRFTAEKQMNPGAVRPVKGQEAYEPFYMHTEAADTWTYDTTTYRESVFAPLFRWRTDFQHDFAARMDWSMTPDYDAANHNPEAVMNGDKGKDILYISARAGEMVELSAKGSVDPDGDNLSYEWYQYAEAGTYPGVVKLESDSGESTAFRAPEVDQPATVHMILRVQDDGTPWLVAYRRAIITLSP